MPEIQKRLCPLCGQTNDYATERCSFCAASLDEEIQENEAQPISQTGYAVTGNASEGSTESGITKEELQIIATQERSQMPFPELEQKNRRFFLGAMILVPLLFLVLAAVFGVLATISDISRVSR